VLLSAECALLPCAHSAAASTEVLGG
jgi:hypothetical protein